MMANRLITEQSPYLLQHAHNPVDWYPWGDEAFDVAAKENKPVLVSIGYSACHWCHVMERESFEDTITASLMNERFICIKVDREEHPDVDQYYMDAVQLINGNGGWPLNVFVTPGRQPFYGGTYFPPVPAHGRPSWLQLCNRIAELWEFQSVQVSEQTNSIADYLMKMAGEIFPRKIDDNPTVDMKLVTSNLLKLADVQCGGFGSAPKFPATMSLGFLIEHDYFFDHPLAMLHAKRSLHAMINGGIYDQLGGGFSRYSTDRNWLVPHFEKMLYDNALLVIVLAEYYLRDNDSQVLEVITDTLAFADRELMDDSGGYYCALDADSEGVEGKFYTWTMQEIDDILGKPDSIFSKRYGVLEEGNWDGVNILHHNATISELADLYIMAEKTIEVILNDGRKKLFEQRNSRYRPQLDDKCLISWNALMNKALIKAAIATGDYEYLDDALRNMNWMLDSFFVDGKLMHVWKNGRAKISAKLDDYAFLISSLFLLGAVTCNDDFLLKGIALTADVLEKFSHPDEYFYFTSFDQKDIPIRKVELYDGAIPSGNSVMAENLWIAGMCAEKPEWINKSEEMILRMKDRVISNTYSYSNWATLLQRNISGMFTLILSNGYTNDEIKAIRAKFMPQMTIFACKKEKSEIPLLKNKHFGNKKYIFVCSKTACYSPVTTFDEVTSLIGGIGRMKQDTV